MGITKFFGNPQKLGYGALLRWFYKYSLVCGTAPRDKGVKYQQEMDLNGIDMSGGQNYLFTVIATGKTGSSPIRCEDFGSVIPSGRKCCSLQ